MKPGELAYLKFRWKAPGGDSSQLTEMPVMKSAMAESFDGAGNALRFSAAVAAYGQKLRDNANLRGTKWSEILSWAGSANKGDPYRAEFIQLVKLAAVLSMDL
jgi:Ca-activated chloride channel family protein